MALSWQLHCGDALTELAKLSEQSVQCCITSPPYFGLRDYGIDGQVGLEETPEKYIERLVAIFAGVWRVLRDDGTLWIVIGDSYSAQGGSRTCGTSGFLSKRGADVQASRNMQERVRQGIEGLKPKDLVGVPWMLAFALRAFGYYLRSECVWAKSISGPLYRGGSCMPEAVTDRPTKSHETIFMLSKQERYFFDHEAIKEPAVQPDRERADQFGGKKLGGSNVWHSDGSVFTGATKRNMRSVWHMNPKAFKGAHFAVYPEALVAPMVLAGSRPGDTVLDPFAGAGTTLLVAAEHGRSAIGIELNPEYVGLAKARLVDAGHGGLEDCVQFDELIDTSRVCWGEGEP